MSYELSVYLAKIGHQVIFFLHQPRVLQHQIQEPLPEGLEIRAWPGTGRPNQLRHLFWFLKIGLKFKPHLVVGHFSGAIPAILGSKLLFWRRTKTFIYYHTLRSQLELDRSRQNLLGMFRFWRRKLFYRLFCDSVLANSVRAKQDFDRHFKMSKSISHLTPLPDRFQGLSEPTRQLCFLGRLDRSKGLDILLKAVSKCQKELEKDGVSLVIAGSGQLESVLQEMPPFCRYLGRLPYSEVDKLINNSMAVCIPSRTDNLVTVGLETLMNGVALLISKETGLADYLEHGVDCVKFEPHSDSLEHVLRAILANQYDLKAIGRQGRETYKRLFSVPSYCKVMEQILGLKGV
ncbi:MAG: glycosyltransferase family 4 protein [Acidobacteria bacterium]|nr:glycosyltransferase family 4 protein [Acidobacteriota bacterium]